MQYLTTVLICMTVVILLWPRPQIMLPGLLHPLCMLRLCCFRLYSPLVPEVGPGNVIDLHTMHCIVTWAGSECVALCIHCHRCWITGVYDCWGRYRNWSIMSPVYNDGGWGSLMRGKKQLLSLVWEQLHVTPLSELLIVFRDEDVDSDECSS